MVVQIDAHDSKQLPFLASTNYPIIVEEKLFEEKFIEAEDKFRLFLIGLGDQALNTEEMKRVIQLGKRVLNSSRDPLLLVSLLLKSLGSFPTLYQEQLDLADLSAQKLLNQAQEKPADQRLALYTTAMLYYGKALAIAKKFDPSQVKHLSTKASKIFMLVIEDQLVTLGSFRRRLTLARGSGNLANFQRVLDEITLLKNYRCDLQDHQTILSLYSQAEAVLLDHQQSGKETEPFAPHARRILQEQQEPYLPHNSVTASERYQTAIKTFRDTFANQRKGLTQQNVRIFQKTTHQQFLSFFQTFLQDAFAILGPPPCAYELRACGSLAREEFCPYSDLEWMILIEDLKYIFYFKTLAEILNLQIVSLGETAATDLPVFSALGEMNRSGFHVDTGGNPATDDLIGTPQTLALFQKPKEEIISDDTPTLAFHSLRRTTSLEENSTLPLFESYTKEMNAHFDENNLRQKRALNLLKFRLKDYQARFDPHWRQNPLLNIKEKFVELLYHPLSDLALYFNCPETNTLDLIDALPCFTPDSLFLLKEAVSTIYLLRTRLHLQYEEQKETASQTGQLPQNNLPLLEEEKFILEKIYCLVLRPFYTYLENLFNQENPIQDIDLLNLAFEAACLEDPFSKETFFHIKKHLFQIGKQSFQNPEIFYAELSHQLQPVEHIRRAYLETLHDPKLKEALALIPNPKGYRQVEQIRRDELHEAIQSTLTPYEERSSHGFSIALSGPMLDRSHYLKKELVEEILDPKTGDLQGIYKNTHSRVTRSEKHQLHFKQAPSNPNKESPFHPGKERAASSLMFRLFGHGTSVGELLEFTVDHPKYGKKQYLVHISKTIPGTNLSEVSDQQLQTINPINLTDFFLSLPLLLPGDMRPANMIVQGNRLVSIDNDVSWVRPMTKGVAYGHWYNLYTILPFLFPDHALHPTSIERFLTLKAGPLLVDWLEELIVYNQGVQKHFSHYEDIAKGITIRALFEKEMGGQLYSQFLRLQTFLQEQPLNTPALAILKSIINFHEETTTDIGQKLFDRYSKGLTQKGTPSAQVKWVTDRDAYQSMSATKSTASFYKSLPTSDEGLKDHLPQKVLSEIGSLLVLDFGNFFFQNNQGIARLEKGFEETTDPAQQQILLKALLQHRYETLNLSNCQVLTDEALAMFLSRSKATLKTLILRNCPLLTMKAIPSIMICSTLEELYLSHSQGIERFVIPRLIGQDLPVQLPKLKALHLSNSPNLTDFNIIALELKELKVDMNPRLTKGVLEAPSCEVLSENSPLQIEWGVLSIRTKRQKLIEQEEMIEQYGVFGIKKWEQYFGDIGIGALLPPNIQEILNAPCPIWPGKKVYETHLLTLIPQTVNGQPLTLKTLGELVQKPLQGPATKYSYLSLGEYQDPPNLVSHWTLFTRDVIPNSRRKRYAAQEELAQQYPGYEIPHVLDATVSIFMEHVQSGTRLYSDKPYTFTLCQEKYDAHWQLVVGCFAANGLFVCHVRAVEYGLNVVHDTGYENFGVGISRKLS